MIIAESILNSLQQPILVLDGNLRPALANPAFYNTFGLAQGDLQGKFIQDFIAGKNCDAPIEKLLSSIISGEGEGEGEVVGVEALCNVLTPSNRPLYLMVNARRVPASGPIEMIILEPRDISLDKEVQNCIQDLNMKLQKRAIAVDMVNEELESYSHSVSHDLRSPLRFVNRIAHLLLNDPGLSLSEKAAEQVNMILSATEEMGQLIERLLLFSQASREPMLIRRVDMKKLFQDAEKELRYEARGRDVEIVLEDIPTCHGDRTLLKEVVENLLGNAFKFAQRREKARITIGYYERNGVNVYFVKDNGAGFDMKESDSLFLPFHRLHKEEDFKGSGIGLALVKRIIERHGGQIWAEGIVDEGATFYFTLGEKSTG